MPFTIHKDAKGDKFFILKKRLAVTKDGRVVPDTDHDAVRLIGGVGSLVSQADAKKYKLDASHVESDEEAYVPPEAETKAEEPAPGEIEVPEDLKGKLPEDFPGHAALAEAGINTYAQLRKAGDVTEVSGIGPATAKKIAEALAATPEGEE